MVAHGVVAGQSFEALAAAGDLFGPVPTLMTRWGVGVSDGLCKRGGLVSKENRL